jgi:hypothetical protein
MQMWLLHLLGKTYGSRPSEIMGLAEEPWLAYQFDVLALRVGNQVEAAVAEGGSVEDALGQTGDGRRATDDGQFRDPRPMVTRKVAVGPDGTW